METDDQPSTEVESMSAEDEATLAMLMGDEGTADLLAGLGISATPTESPELIEAKAKEQAEYITKARTYDVAAGARNCRASIDALQSALIATLNTINEHATLEWNKAILAEKEGQSYEDCLSREDIQKLNAVRFLEEGAKEVDKGIALLKVVLMR